MEGRHRMNLTALDIADSRITSKGVKKLALISSLTRLNISGCMQVTTTPLTFHFLFIRN